MIIPYHDKSRKRKKKNLTKKLSIFNAYINFKLSKVSNSRAVGIKKLRGVLIAGLIADASAIITAIILVNIGVI